MRFEETGSVYHCEGDWTVLLLDGFTDSFHRETLPRDAALVIDGSQLGLFDSAGALALAQCVNLLNEQGNTLTFQGFSKTHEALMNLVDVRKDVLAPPPPRPNKPFLWRVGAETISKLDQADGFIMLIGDMTTRLAEALGNWRRFRIPSIASNVYSTGVQALPILALLSFLIGVVLAYQMGLQLQTYGANIFIAYLSGLAIFREFSPLITAIIVAGRTSSAFTAQIGSMKINEEVDALETMGLSPVELLVLPKVLGLLLVFPLLIFWSDMFSLAGAAIMSKWMLSVGYIDFMERLRASVGLEQLMLGLYKAPAFALIIALVGCFQGFRVEANADSIGSQTTRSVVQALFLIIIADAVYSIIYSWLDL